MCFASLSLLDPRIFALTLKLELEQPPWGWGGFHCYSSATFLCSAFSLVLLDLMAGGPQKCFFSPPFLAQESVRLKPLLRQFNGHWIHCYMKVIAISFAEGRGR